MNTPVQLDSVPSHYADHFDGYSAIFIEDDYIDPEITTCFEVEGDLSVEDPASFVADLEARADATGRGKRFALFVKGNATFDGLLDLEGDSHCLAVVGDLRVSSLYAGSYSYVSVSGDLEATRAVLSQMMTDAGICVDGACRATFKWTAMHAHHQMKLGPETIDLEKAKVHLPPDMSNVCNPISDRNLLLALEQGKHPFDVPLEALRRDAAID